MSGVSGVDEEENEIINEYLDAYMDELEEKQLIFEKEKTAELKEIEKKNKKELEEEKKKTKKLRD